MHVSGFFFERSFFFCLLLFLVFLHSCFSPIPVALRTTDLQGMTFVFLLFCETLFTSIPLKQSRLPCTVFRNTDVQGVCLCLFYMYLYSIRRCDIDHVAHVSSLSFFICRRYAERFPPNGDFLTIFSRLSLRFSLPGTNTLHSEDYLRSQDDVNLPCTCFATNSFPL